MFSEDKRKAPARNSPGIEKIGMPDHDYIDRRQIVVQKVLKVNELHGFAPALEPGY
jgi:hypothetical protein